MGFLSFSDRLLWCSFTADKVAVMVNVYGEQERFI